MADFCAAYHFEPRHDMPWPLFRSLMHQAHRFDARLRYLTQKGVQAAIASAFGESDQVADDELRRAAYPFKESGPRLAFEQPKPPPEGGELTPPTAPPPEGSDG